MYENKPWYLSKTVWGSLIAVGAAVAAGFGVIVDAGTQDEIAGYAVAIAGAVGGLVAVWGRVKAEKKIGKAE